MLPSTFNSTNRFLFSRRLLCLLFRVSVYFLLLFVQCKSTLDSGTELIILATHYYCIGGEVLYLGMRGIGYVPAGWLVRSVDPNSTCAIQGWDHGARPGRATSHTTLSLLWMNTRHFLGKSTLTCFTPTLPPHRYTFNISCCYNTHYKCRCEEGH